MMHRAKEGTTSRNAGKSPFSISGGERLSCDVLVVGTGAGGASVAAVLARAGIDVLMLEEGPMVVPEQSPEGLGASVLKMWRGGGLLSTLGSTQIAFAEGRCVGGGTEINSAIFQKAPDAVIAQWAVENHLRDFSSSSLAPYYESASNAVNASLDVGPMSTSADILARGGRTMGWNVSQLARGENLCMGTNMCSAGCPTGAKQSMSLTLIPDALSRGARLVADCRVQRLVLRGNRASGAVADAVDRDGCKRRLVISANAIFVCAGTMQTPTLIRRSGFSCSVGTRFQLHPTIRVLARFAAPVNAHRYKLPLVAITEFMPDTRFGGSLFTPSTYAMALAEDWHNRSQWLKDFRHHAMYYVMIRPEGTGRIHTVPTWTEPFVTYRLTNRDWQRITEGVRNLTLCLLAAGAERVVPAIRGHEGWTNPDQLHGTLSLSIARKNAALMSIHLFGSCPMGEGTSYPIDSYGRVSGVDNVTIADGSALPGAPGVNPQATIMAIAFRAAEAFLTRRRSQ